MPRSPLATLETIMEFKNAKRRVTQVDLHLGGAPERVFPLLCPVREYDWIDGWSCEMVYSDTGVAEPGGIFRTRFADLGEETWTISRYEPNRAIEFVRVAGNRAVVKLDIALDPEGGTGTRARVRHTYTTLSPAGEPVVEAWTQGRAEQEWGAVAQMLNHYLRTGTKLPRPETARALRR
jgi:hypothetical protein